MIKTLNALILIFAFPFLLSAQWVQKGIDIDGEAGGDRSGAIISMPDTVTIAIGATGNNGNGTDAGHVRVFKWSGTQWVQKGSDIDGEAAGDLSGNTVSMPDSNTVAIGAPLNNGSGSNAGHVRVFKWSGAQWVQKGSDIDGEAVADYSGIVSMPDSNTIAIGAPGNDGSAVESGHVRVFKWSGNAWTQKGSDIDGEGPGDRSGQYISMPDSNTLAIGAHNNDGVGIDAGHVRVFKWSGTQWVQKGIDIDGETARDRSGIVNMPDSNTVAIGATLNDGNGIDAGHVRVFKWSGNSWIQKGADIDGEAVADQSGSLVSMADSNTVAIGAIRNDGNGLNSGHVRVYQWTGNAWVQMGSDIDGEAAGDLSGTVAMASPNTLAVGAHENDGNGGTSGHVRVFTFNLPTSLNESIATSGFNIFPNPTKGELVLETKNAIGEFIQIYSIKGNVLKEITISQNRETINLSSFEHGVYFLRLGFKNKRIVKID